MKFVTAYNKLIVSVLLNTATVFEQYPNVHWQQIGLSAIGSVLVWLVPNSQPLATVTPISTVKGSSE